MKNNSGLFLSVIVPVFNEENTIAKILKKTLAATDEYSEIIVIDDGSTDKTSRMLAKFEGEKRVRIITLPRNSGKGFAVREGLRSAKGGVFIIQDADLEYDPQDYRKLLAPIRAGKAAVVYGSRLANYPLNFKNLRTIPLPLNFLANKFLSFLTNLLYGVKLTDMETCYKAFTRQVYESINLTKNRFEIEVELTVKILQAGFTITEVPIKTQPRNYSQGKKISPKDGVLALLTLLEYRLDNYSLGVFGVIFAAVFFRFWNFSEKYGLWSDQARDALVGRISVAHRSLPLIGSFSSAGPFTFGPFWYWQSALASILFKSHMGYWILTGIFSVLMVAVLIWIGKAIGGKFMGLVLGLLAAVSFTQIQASLGSTQHSMVGVMTTFFLAMVLVYLKKGSAASLFLAGFFLSLTINYHYQAFYLLPMFGILLLIRRPGVKTLFWGFVGLLIPFLPLLAFDLQHNWWNLSKMIDYYRFGQYRIYVPNRWLTYAGIFWPDFWAKTVGGFRATAYLTMFLISTVYVLKLVKRKLSRGLLVYGLGFLTAIIWFRYFRAARYDGYVVYAQPLILIFTAWILNEIWKKSKKLGIFLCVIVMAGSLATIYKDFGYRNIYQSIKGLRTSLIQAYPNRQFALYDRQFITSGCSISLSLLLDELKATASNGVKIGVCNKNGCPEQYPAIASAPVGEFDCQLVILDKLSEEDRANWVLVSPEAVNRMTVEWWKE